MNNEPRFPGDGWLDLIRGRVVLVREYGLHFHTRTLCPMLEAAPKNDPYYPVTMDIDEEGYPTVKNINGEFYVACFCAAEDFWKKSQFTK